MEECTREEYEIGTFFYRMNQTEDFIVNPAEQQRDWGNCIYFFLRKGDLTLYKDTDHPYPMKFQNLRKFPYIKCTYRCFVDEKGYDKEMPAIIQEIETLTISKKPPVTPFMQWLGNIGYAFQCYHAGTWEVAIPVSLLSRLDFREIVDFS